MSFSTFSRTESGALRFLSGLGLMHEDPASFLNVRGGVPDASDMMAEVLSRTTPTVKYPWELATGESLFMRDAHGGREFVDMDPTIGRTLTNVGLREELPSGRARPFISPGFENLAANSPLARALTSARTVTDPRKYEGDLPGLGAAINLGTGFRVTDLSPAAQDAILRDETQALMQDLGAHKFERTFFTKDDIARTEKTDPESAEQMKRLNALLNALGRRSKARREAAE